MIAFVAGFLSGWFILFLIEYLLDREGNGVLLDELFVGYARSLVSILFIPLIATGIATQRGKWWEI